MEHKQKPTWEVIEAVSNTVLFKGKAETLQFKSWDISTAKPMWVRFEDLTNEIIVCFPSPSNIRVMPEKDKAGRITLWCEAAITKEQLEKLQTENEEAKVFSES